MSDDFEPWVEGDTDPQGEFAIQTSRERDEGAFSHMMEHDRNRRAFWRDGLYDDTRARFDRAGIVYTRLEGYGSPSRVHRKIRNAVNALRRYEAKHGPTS